MIERFIVTFPHLKIVKGRNDKDSISKDRIPGIILRFLFQPTNVEKMYSIFLTDLNFLQEEEKRCMLA